MSTTECIHVYTYLCTYMCMKYMPMPSSCRLNLGNLRNQKKQPSDKYKFLCVINGKKGKSEKIIITRSVAPISLTQNFKSLEYI